MSVQLNALADHKRQLLEKIAGQRLLLHSQIAGYQKPLQALNAAHGFANGIGVALRRHGIAIAIGAAMVTLVVVRGGLVAKLQRGLQLVTLRPAGGSRGCRAAVSATPASRRASRATSRVTFHARRRRRGECCQ